MAVIFFEDSGEKIKFEGITLAEGEMNYYDDSDFYVVIWDETNQCVRNEEYATTRFACPHSRVIIDATDEVKEKAEAYIKKEIINFLTQEVDKESRIVEQHKEVIVVNGKHKNKIGNLFWEGKNKFPPYDVRYGIQLFNPENNSLINEKIYVSKHDVEVYKPERYLTMTKEEIESSAEKTKKNYRSLSMINSRIRGMWAV